MKNRMLIVKSYFDGRKLHRHGPYTIRITDGLIEAVDGGVPVESLYSPAEIIHAEFAMPGLVEAHAHLFLDGGELNFERRNEYLKSDTESMMETGRRNLRLSRESGITLIRDAGDIHGINHALKEEIQSNDEFCPRVRAAGRAIRKMKRYGSFMAIEVDTQESIVAAVNTLAPLADDLKVLLTGIIDFEKGTMKGAVQFDTQEACLITAAARGHGKKTFVHCSGLDGLKIAVEAGFDSIEHGFFMNREILNGMAEKQLAWVPTFCPVYFQYARPELAGWQSGTVARLWTILDNHYQHIQQTRASGTPLIAGSDAGSYGVPHGISLINELCHMQKAGLSLETVLASATSVPRSAWGCESADIRKGLSADIALFDRSPDDDLRHLYQAKAIVMGEKLWTAAPLAQEISAMEPICC